MKFYFGKSKTAQSVNDPVLFYPTVAYISERNSHLLLVVDEQEAEMTVDTDMALAFLRESTIKVDVIRLPVTSGKNIAGSHTSYHIPFQEIKKSSNQNIKNNNKPLFRKLKNL
ncbi:hypothetical protein DPMN_078882 [Dreissena polymorpha]|uniref:Uncharacterized protein n=1 Tax=Dreissena polymorpha TaxID=45954 RepID=A0A9D3YS06_DREPO|nr:hypothetical protein DPMN_078882 [Dreissena polymorpha]